MWPTEGKHYSRFHAEVPIGQGAEKETPTSPLGKHDNHFNRFSQPLTEQRSPHNNAQRMEAFLTEDKGWGAAAPKAPFPYEQFPHKSLPYRAHSHHIRSLVSTTRPRLALLNPQKNEHPNESVYSGGYIASEKNAGTHMKTMNVIQSARSRPGNIPAAPCLSPTVKNYTQSVKISNHRPYTLQWGNLDGTKQSNPSSPASLSSPGTDPLKSNNCVLCTKKARFPVPPSPDTASFFSTDGKVIWTAPLNYIEQLPSKEKNITRLVCCANYRPIISGDPFDPEIDDQNDIRGEETLMSPHEDGTEETFSALDELTSLSPSTTFSQRGLSFLASADEGNAHHVLNSDTFSVGASQVDDGATGPPRKELERLQNVEGASNTDAQVWRCKYGENCKYVHIKMDGQFPILSPHKAQFCQKAPITTQKQEVDPVFFNGSWQVGAKGSKIQIQQPLSPVISFTSEWIYCHPVHINYVWKDVSDCVLYARYVVTGDAFEVYVEGSAEKVPISQFLCTAGMNNFLSQCSVAQDVSSYSSSISRCHSFHGHGYCPEAENCKHGHLMTVDPSIDLSSFKWAKADVKRGRARFPAGRVCTSAQDMGIPFQSSSTDRGSHPEPPKSLPYKKCPSFQDLHSGSSPSLTVSNSGYGRDSITTASTLNTDRQPVTKSHLSAPWLFENPNVPVRTIDSIDFSSTSSRTGNEVINSSTTFHPRYNSSLSLKKNQQNFEGSGTSAVDSVDKSPSVNTGDSLCSSVLPIPPTSASPPAYPRTWSSNVLPPPPKERETVFDTMDQPYQRAGTDLFVKEEDMNSFSWKRAATTIVSEPASSHAHGASSPTRREGSKKVVRHNPYSF